MSTSLYAWHVDRDELERTENRVDGPGVVGCEGVVGPRGANGQTKAELDANYPHHHAFKMYDDDGILYVTGTLYWVGDPDSPASDHDDFTYGPLRDYGGPALGCVRVAYPGRPHWDCG